MQVARNLGTGLRLPIPLCPEMLGDCEFEKRVIRESDPIHSGLSLALIENHTLAEEPAVIRLARHVDHVRLTYLGHPLGEHLANQCIQGRFGPMLSSDVQFLAPVLLEDLATMNALRDAFALERFAEELQNVRGMSADRRQARRQIAG